MSVVRIFNGALQASERGPGGVLRGLVDCETFSAIHVPPYQRGNLQDKSLAESFLDPDARLPDVELAMRGHRYNRDSDVFELLDPVFVLDGLQRISSAQHYVNSGGNPAHVEIGALINFDTTEEWEKARFETLNRARRRVSADLMLRNRRDRHPGLLMLYELSMHDPAFPLHGRVSWQQMRARRDLIGSFALSKACMALHLGVCGFSAKLEETIAHLDIVVHRIGSDIMRTNFMTFFDLVEENWKVRELPFVRSAIPVKEDFLIVLARILADHDAFWVSRGARGPKCHLFISQKWRQKLRGFPLEDRNVVQLLISGGAKSARSILYEMLVRHLNSGKKTGHLTARETMEWADETPRKTKKKPDDGTASAEARS
jgi:hypothetical protein